MENPNCSSKKWTKIEIYRFFFLFKSIVHACFDPSCQTHRNSELETWLRSRKYRTNQTLWQFWAAGTRENSCTKKYKKKQKRNTLLYINKNRGYRSVSWRVVLSSVTHMTLRIPSAKSEKNWGKCIGIYLVSSRGSHKKNCTRQQRRQPTRRSFASFSIPCNSFSRIKRYQQDITRKQGKKRKEEMKWK